VIHVRQKLGSSERLALVKQAETVIATWLDKYNLIRPNWVLNMRPPVPETLARISTWNYGFSVFYTSGRSRIPVSFYSGCSSMRLMDACRCKFIQGACIHI
jgi:hypothetical protein